MIESYGVFSRFTADSDDDDAEETLYRVEDTPQVALMWLARHVLFRLYGSVPTPVIIRVMETFDKLIDVSDISKDVNIAGLIYYVRVMDEKEVLTLAKDGGLLTTET